MTTNYDLWRLFGPATWPLWLLGAACVCLLLRDRTGRWLRWGRRLALASFALFVVFAVLPTGYMLIRPLETRFQAAPLAPAPRDIVVLAGSEALAQSEFAGRPEFTEAGERVMEGAMLARRLPKARLWIVGGIRLPGSSSPDITWTATAWRRLGIESTQIGSIDGTRDTCANAEGVAARGIRHPLLVTSASHMPRAVACFRKAGIEPRPYPVDYNLVRAGRSRATSMPANLRRLDTALHEWVGLLYYRLSGRTAELLPAP